MHRGPTDVYGGRGCQLLTAFSQGRVRLLLMEVLDHRQIRLNLSRIPSTMRSRCDTARAAVASEQLLDKAQTHSKEPR